ncbi:hypothetical protein FGE12_03305 [Aggregicoccus sp. 17bor-14]|nr:hypothetical protein [Simulacricoccus sp. 17bor-14]MRI87185.1 hypothetical protein [Aggregicoccus sp. 17bor-14]
MALTLLWLGTGCATSTPELRGHLAARTAVGQFQLAYAQGDDEATAQVREALERAGPRLARWGALDEPVQVQVLPSHRALEHAVDRSGYGWLRAWARYDEVFVQSPSTWYLGSAAQREVNELMLHELTHCLMYQLAASRLSWSRKRIPLWFREGMASYTAEQGSRWASLEDLARHLESSPGEDPLRAGDELYRDESDLVYGAAHQAFTFLVLRYGEPRVRALLAEMKRGPTFPEAFASVVGLPVDSFLQDFLRYVRLRGFRPGRLRHTVALPGDPIQPPAPAPAPVAPR